MDDFAVVAAALKKHGFSVKTFSTGAEAAAYLLETISPEESVGIGGALTVKQLGMADSLAERGNTVHWHWNVGKDEAAAARSAALVANVYLCSANAVITDGRLLNIDGTGNRLAAMLYGPGRVYVVAGRNKLAGNYDEAMQRVKNVACPGNALRLGLDTPCAALGYCTDCDSPRRMCRGTLLLERAPYGHSMEIILVNEDLGL